jgi:glycosyltransferase involved in cell wall biosynthesis
MIYIGIPAHNEAQTIGVLLWRIRKVFLQFPREYELLVYDDASTDETAEVLRPYADVLPLTVIRGERRLGYAGALDVICRTAAQRTRYARRDALVTMQGDFTDQPEHLPDLIRRFEGGVDLVVVEQASPRAATNAATDAATNAAGGGATGAQASALPARAPVPTAVRRLRRAVPWLVRAFVRVPGVGDPFSAFRLYRISVLRDAIKALGPDTPLVTRDGWAANAELLLLTAPLARRVETVPLAPRYDLRQRESRVRPFADALRLYRFGRAARALQAARSG